MYEITVKILSEDEELYHEIKDILFKSGIDISDIFCEEI